MSRARALFLALSLALAPLAMAMAADESPDIVAADDLSSLLRATGEAERAGDAAAMEARVLEVLSHPDFPTLSSTAQHALRSAAGGLAVDRGDLAGAYRHVRSNTRSAHAGPGDWRLRAGIEADLGWHDAAMDSLRELLERWPAEANLHEWDYLPQVIYTTPSDNPARQRLLRALFDAGFEYPDLGAPDLMWFELAVGHLGRDETDAARQVLEDISDTSVLVRILADRRFDAIRDPGLSPADLPALARDRVTDLRTRAVLDPMRLEIQAELASAMLVAGQHEDVVALAEEVREAVSSPGRPVPYVDADEYLPWLYNRAGEALARLGRRDEALAMYRRAAHDLDAPKDGVSHQLNLAHRLLTAGKPREALALVVSMPRMSPYGRMVLMGVQHRAALQMDESEAAAVAMAYLSENRQHNAGAYVEARLDAGHTDEAAAALIARLDDPDERAEALYGLQDFQPGGSLGDFEVGAGLDELLEREDVKAAIERNGRILELPIWMPW